MQVSERTLKWALNFYPPLLFQRICVRRFHTGFRGVDVQINNSFLNRNYNGSIFGGTIYAAADPFYSILFDQLMQKRGFSTRVWLKSASIQYLKPGRKTLYFTISISEEMIAAAEQALSMHGKYVESFPLEIFDRDGTLCATVVNEIYVRNTFTGEDKRVAI